ncbi:META domain-containing protein [Robertkochia marina]|uniref:META domain-containing protein n=1 Tax=Robertkochia marina TaxID=1227945 RepID=A0A4S3LZX7_9FLAO|nr:META domain-containing protein [Robertkochia marina]THD66297.1 META domain-containing protein [Robertkochia marina]TRZ41218.1 META domain-containing protein [Robertkochia marina]
MMKLKPFCALLTLFVMTIAGCGQKEQKNNSESRPEKSEVNDRFKASDSSKQKETMTFFKAQGNEPFWNLTLNDQQLIFTSMLEGYEEFITPLPQVNRAADANVKRYRAATEKVTLTATITHEPCADTMADNNYEYQVALEVQLTGDSKPVSLKGCGNYVTDYRLQDIWILEKLGEEIVQEGWFAKEPPTMEVNVAENRFTGYAGCNQMRGNIFWEPGLLRFTDVISTRKACLPENKEGEFLDKLRKTTTYSIENNRLMLSNPNHPLMVFRKTD